MTLTQRSVFKMIAAARGTNERTLLVVAYSRAEIYSMLSVHSLTTLILLRDPFQRSV